MSARQDDADVYEGINTLMQIVNENSRSHGFWDDEANYGGDEAMYGLKIALMHSELSEALEAVRTGEPMLHYEHPIPYGGSIPVEWSERPDIDGHLGKPQGLASELADCIIRICDLAEQKGIPLAEAIIRKHRYNVTRPYMHGKTC